MKSFFKKHQSFLLETIIFSLIVLIAFVVMNSMNYTFGTLDTDFQAQHVRFIDYLRQSFFLTGDLAPQLNMNYGGGQSMSTLFYYGQYNPLIFISYFLPFLSTMTFLQISSYLMIVFSFIGMNLLLRQLKIDHRIGLVVSILYAFAGPLIFHQGYHLMFVYYFPIMPFSLISINYLIKTKKMWPFIICVGLIFYTNFFFALVIGLSQLLYFIGYYFYIQKEKVQPFNKLLIRLILSYVIGIGLGMIIFLPQALVILNGSRSESGMEYDFATLKYFKDIAYSKYCGGLVVIPLFSIIYAFLNRKDKFSLFIMIFLIIFMIFTPLSSLLNYFIYNHTKVLIYMSILFFVVFAYQLSNKMNIVKMLISLVLATILVLLLPQIVVEGERYHLISPAFYWLLGFQVLLIIYFYFRKYNIVVSWIFGIALAVASISYSLTVIEKPDMENKVLLNQFKNKEIKQDLERGYYRVNYNNNNLVKNIDEFESKIYVSTPNPNWWEFHDKFIKMPYSHLNRVTLASLYKNYVFRNFFGLQEQIKDSENAVAQSKDSLKDIRPFIYGVENNYVFDYKDLKSLAREQRIFALLQGVFTDDSTKEFKYKKPTVKQVYKSDKDIKINHSNEFKVKLDNEFRHDGVFIIDVNVKNTKIGKTSLYVNGSLVARFAKKSLFNPSDIRSSYIYYPAGSNIKNLKFTSKGKDIVYDKIDIKYISNDELRKNNMPYVKTNDNKVEYNKSYKFNLELKTPGYLGTSIFYDDGFIIKDNGKVIPKDKINGYFLGAKLSEGKHSISIDYEMPGFKIGAVISFIALFILGFIMVDEIRFFNRPFFRFVLVGVFNTINYFIGYTLLLMISPYLFAHIVAFIYSAFCSYFLTSYYTFRMKPTLKTFIAFPLTFLPNLLLSSFGTMLLVELNILNKNIASLVMMILIIPITFLINKLIFKQKNN